MGGVRPASTSLRRMDITGWREDSEGGQQIPHFPACHDSIRTAPERTPTGPIFGMTTGQPLFVFSSVALSPSSRIYIATYIISTLTCKANSLYRIHPTPFQKSSRAMFFSPMPKLNSHRRRRNFRPQRAVRIFLRTILPVEVLRRAGQWCRRPLISLALRARHRHPRSLAALT